jgi:hypothetical protein
MIDGYSTQDIWLAAVIMLAYTTDCLTKIELDESEAGKRMTPTFFLDIASMDGEIMADDLKNGLLGVSDILALSREYSFLTRTLSQMTRGEQRFWVSKSYLGGRGK